jgi:hypothetical protein
MDKRELELFEQAVLKQSPPRAKLVGVSISPDGNHGASLTYLPTATYLMDNLFVRTSEGWEDDGGGSAGGGSWTAIGEDDGIEVLRYGDEAPAGAAIALIESEGQKHRIPVRHGHFFFVAWNVSSSAIEEPLLLGFE